MRKQYLVIAPGAPPLHGDADRERGDRLCLAPSESADAPVIRLAERRASTARNIERRTQAQEALRHVVVVSGDIEGDDALPSTHVEGGI